MRQRKLTKEQFLTEVANHTMEVITDDGVTRELIFSHNGSSIQRFRLVTFNGYLCYTGDMGSYLFKRTPDMFEFFRQDEKDWGINTQYWAEKVEAVDRNSGITEFSLELYEEAVNSYLNDWLEEAREDEQDHDFIEDQKDKIKSLIEEANQNKHHAIAAANNWEPDENGVDLTDFWEHTVEDYTHRFKWACCAIVWGIIQYDKYKSELDGE